VSPELDDIDETLPYKPVPDGKVLYVRYGDVIELPDGQRINVVQGPAILSPAPRKPRDLSA
jgi:hypothetical protein